MKLLYRNVYKNSTLHLPDLFSSNYPLVLNSKKISHSFSLFTDGTVLRLHKINNLPHKAVGKNLNCYYEKSLNYANQQVQNLIADQLEEYIDTNTVTGAGISSLSVLTMKDLEHLVCKANGIC